MYRYKKNINNFLLLVSFAMLASFLFSYLGSFHFIPDLFAHFKRQYLVVSLLLLLLNVVFFNRALAIVACLAVICLSALELKAAYFYEDIGFSGSANLTIFHANVLSSNKQYPKLYEQIEKYQPTIVGIQEVTSHLSDSLSVSLKNYPYKKVIAREDNFGIALFSKLPLMNIDVVYLTRSGIPTITCEIEVDNNVVQLIYTHPLPPIDTDYFEDRNLQFNALATMVGNAKPTIVFGDLNVSPWSVNFKDFLHKSELAHSSKGIFATWPSFSAHLGIPIDHFLHTKRIKVEEVLLTDEIGSDHMPLVARYLVE